MLLDVLGRLTTDATPLMVVDTHAGAGLYDLEGEAARRSGEAASGVVRLMADPAPDVFAPLKAIVEKENAGGHVRRYPGSPLVALDSLRPGDRYLGCELHPDDQAALAALLAERRRPKLEAEVLLADGYEVLAEGRLGARRRLVLVDPPFERGDEYQRMVEGVAADARRGGGVHLIWTPLKDLQTFDSFLGALEAERVGAGVAIETRLRPLDDPLRLNGCAMVILGPPRLLADAEGAAMTAASWIARRLGGPGAEARLERLS